MRLRVGTSGFSFKEWKGEGKFYPEDLPDREMLRYYAERFDAVEINNTFYRMPSPELLARWREQVPEGFCFVLKAPQRITHQKRLGDAGDSVAYLFDKAAALGERLGPVLFQLPPYFRKDLPRLAAFLAKLPAGRRAAMEFRHVSWLDDEVFDALRAQNVALCLADGELAEEMPVVSTADWGYLRLRRVAYEDAALARWVEQVRAQPWGETYAFFKHEDEATGPKLARRFLELFAAIPPPPS